MWIVGKLELAQTKCSQGCTHTNCYNDSVSSWDQAVALYSGTNSGDSMPFQDANVNCKYFATCGENQEIAEGTAQINYKVMDLFRVGQSIIVEGNCHKLNAIKEQIETFMIVPNIQGTLRNIWKGYDRGEKGGTLEIEEHRSEAMAYALALLPLVYSCSTADAEIIHTTIANCDLNLEAYKSVKDALERNYDCLAVDCYDVGGFSGESGEGYMDFHPPCGISDSSLCDEDRLSSDEHLPSSSKDQLQSSSADQMQSSSEDQMQSSSEDQMQLSSGDPCGIALSSSSDEDQSSEDLLQSSMAENHISSIKVRVGLGLGIPVALALFGVIVLSARGQSKSGESMVDSMTALDIEASEPSVKHPEKDIN